jgi:glucose-1-phosphate cytidylyltransferase
MKTIIFCGGIGTRLHEETEFKPKPMVKIGDDPILLHIMNQYAHYGHKDFILCLGYKGEMIKDYFLTLSRYSNNFHYNMRTGQVRQTTKNRSVDYKITFVETGLETTTAGRLLKALPYVDDKYFMATYGDGVSNIDINKLIKYHMEQEKKFGTIATISAVHPQSKYGKVSFDENHIVTVFEEKKPILDDYINGGFHVYNRDIIPYLEEKDMLEDTLIKLTADRKLSIYKHEGFWHCMDTMKDYKSLTKLWEGDRPWAVWEKKNPIILLMKKKPRRKKSKSKIAKRAINKRNRTSRK